MAKRERLEDGFTTVDTDEQKWAYVKEFNDLKHKKPGVINIVLDLMRRAGKVGESSELEGVRVILVDKKENLPGQKDTIHYYKIEVEIEGEKHEFFIKRTPVAYKEFGGGVGEMVSSRKAKDILRQHSIEGVEVVDYQFGYEDKENWYFVSKWDDALQHPLSEYIESLGVYIREHPTESDPRRQELADLKQRREKLEKILDQYSDFRQHNMYYNPQTRKIILFDLYEGPLETIKVD